MEGSSLFNPGYLGASFLWWVGQIVDDSTWRDNIIAGNYEDPNSVPGWGRRYKVRIIGLHDQGEVVVPSDQLPWANVMYPITAGGFQTNAGATPQLRQGNMVFGFYLDGQDQQVPVIMGVLGNNSQTILKQIIGDNSVTNIKPGSLATSGYATGAVPKIGTALEVPPDQDLAIKQPARLPSESASQSAQDAQTAAGTTNTSGSQEAGPNAPPQPGATLENESLNQITAADVKRQTKLEERIVLLRPDPIVFVKDALAAIQTVLQNLVARVDKFLQALQSYVDAVSITRTFSAIRKVIRDFACEIARYLKQIYDKIAQYALKVLNEALNLVVAAIPSSFRYLFGDVKQILTELLLCLYNKITAGICDTLEATITNLLGIDALEREVNERIANQDPTVGAVTFPQVGVSGAENLVASLVGGSQGEIDASNNNLVTNVGAFLGDLSAQLEEAGVESGAIDIPDIVGSITAALDFTNIKLNIFGCELAPNIAQSTIYTFADGGDTQEEGQLPSEGAVAQRIESAPPPSEAQEPIPFAEPTKETADVVNKIEPNPLETFANSDLAGDINAAVARGENIAEVVAAREAGPEAFADFVDFKANETPA